jgi:hypothetical protein
VIQWNEKRWVRHALEAKADGAATLAMLRPRFGHSLVIDPFTQDAVVYGGFTREPDWDTPTPRQAVSNDLLSYNLETQASVHTRRVIHPRLQPA